MWMIWMPMVLGILDHRNGQLASAAEPWNDQQITFRTALLQYLPVAMACILFGALLELPTMFVIRTLLAIAVGGSALLVMFFASLQKQWQSIWHSEVETPVDVPWTVRGGAATLRTGDALFDAAVRTTGDEATVLAQFGASQRAALRELVANGGYVADGRAAVPLPLLAKREHVESAARVLAALRTSLDAAPQTLVDRVLHDTDAEVRHRAARVAVSLPGPMGDRHAAAILEASGLTEEAWPAAAAGEELPVAMAAIRMLSTTDSPDALRTLVGLADGPHADLVEVALARVRERLGSEVQGGLTSSPVHAGAIQRAGTEAPLAR